MCAERERGAGRVRASDGKIRAQGPKAARRSTRLCTPCAPSSRLLRFITNMRSCNFLQQRAAQPALNLQPAARRSKRRAAEGCAFACALGTSYHMCAVHVCGHHITSDQTTPLCTDHIKPLYKVSTTSARARPGLAHALHPAGTCVTPISMLCPEPTATHTLKCLAKRVARALVTLRRRARRCLLSCLLSWP